MLFEQHSKPEGLCEHGTCIIVQPMHVHKKAESGGEELQLFQNTKEQEKISFQMDYMGKKISRAGVSCYIPWLYSPGSNGALVAHYWVWNWPSCQQLPVIQESTVRKALFEPSDTFPTDGVTPVAGEQLFQGVMYAVISRS